MPGRHPRLRRRTAAALLLLAAVAWSGQGPPLVSTVEAQTPQPARKDSSARIRPKEVEVSAAVAPVEARPGETVRLQVVAKLKPGWHIYAYTDQPQGEGPVNTRFDLFDPGGLKPAGGWTPAERPVRKKDPAFPDLEAVSYHEGEVVWGLDLKVPDDAAPGPRTLRVQAGYQICDANRCSFPGQWTLPDVTLQIVGNAAATGAAAAAPAKDPAVVSTKAAPPPDTAKPKQKDSPERIRPRAVRLKAAVDPAEVKPGSTIHYRVTAVLDPEWHIFDYEKTQPDTGPRITEFDFFDPAGLTLAGDWASDHPPEIRPEPAFENLPVAFFENEVTWSIALKVPADAAPGPRALRSQISFQVCDPHSCSPPVRWTLPDAVLTVAAGAASASVSASTPAADVPAGRSASAAAKPGPEAAKAVDGAPSPAEAEAPRPTAVSEVERTARQGIVPFLLTSLLGGLLALVMPCVWPMVPITVNFFVKQGQTRKGRTTGLAITYCLAIIGIFTAVGVLCSFFLSASALPRLANNPWLNFAVAGLFLAFGLSLLGLFEIRLPSALLNVSARGESRGGLVGVVFMALTLTITSFTCTFPVVGGLLVMASRGEFFYPIVGLATFATVLALPFFVLALAPRLLSSMPRSGDWMNAVKVVGGLVEIGAAFKFLNTAELAFVTPEDAWFDAQFVLTAWVVLAAVCGCYLLGFFRTDHDHEEVRVGVGRLVFGTSFLGIALYLAPALFGQPPRGLVWDRLVVGLLPPDAYELSAARPSLAAAMPTSGTAGDPAPGESHATSTDPDQAQRQEKRFHGVWWGFSYEQALERARAENRPVLIDFTGVNCANCRLMEARVLPRPEVVDELRKFVTLQLYTAPGVPISSLTADQRRDLGDRNAERQLDMVSEATNPFYVVLSPSGQVLGTIGGYREPQAFLGFLRSSLEKFEEAPRVAHNPS